MNSYNRTSKHLSKFSIFAAIAAMTKYLSKEDGGYLAGTAIHFGISEKALRGMVGLAAELTLPFIPDLVKHIPTISKYDQNNTLEEAVKTAYQFTFKKIEFELVQVLKIEECYYYSAANPTPERYSDEQFLRNQLNNYFGSLTSFLTTPREIAALLEGASILKLDNFWDAGIARCSFLLFPDEELIDKKKLSEYIFEALATEFPFAFVRVLKNDGQARNVYFKLLLEQGLQEIYATQGGTEMIRKKVELIHVICGETNISVHELIGRIADQKEFLANIACQFSPLEKLPADMDAIKTQLTAQGLMIGGLFDTVGEFIEQLRSVAQNIAAIGTAIKTIDEFENSFAIIKEDLQAEGYWFPQLSLSVEVPDTRLNIFSYKTRFTEFVGRNREMSELLNFIHDDAPFKWWMVEGPGGIGKSRLAMELCFKAKAMGFEAGFLSEDNILPDVGSRFEAKFPLLIVIDYALTDEARTLKILTYLHESISDMSRGGGDQLKVRVLLLDRLYKPNWFLRAGDLLTSCHAIRIQNDLPRPMVVQEGGEDLRWRIILQVIERTAPEKLALIEKDHDQVLHTLYQIDGLKRPVYAFFAGEALAVNDSIRGWDVHRLLSFHLARIESRIWANAENYKGYALEFKQLMLINTLMRSMSSEEAKEIIRHWDLYDEEQDIVLRLYSACADSSLVSKPNVFVKVREYYGLLPEVLGEYFVLDLSRKLLDNFVPGRRLLNLYNLAWKFRPELTWWSLSLIYQDFFTGEVRKEFLELKDRLFFESGDENSDFAAAQKAKLMFHISHNNGKLGTINSDLGNLRQSRALYAAHPNNHEIIVKHGKLLQNLTAYDSGNIHEYIAELQELYERNGINESIGLHFLQGIFNSSAIAVTQVDIQRCAEYLSSVSALSDRHAENGQIGSVVLKFLVNLCKLPGGFPYPQLNELLLPLAYKIRERFSKNTDINQSIGFIWFRGYDMAQYGGDIHYFEHVLAGLPEGFEEDEFLAQQFSWLLQISIERATSREKYEAMSALLDRLSKLQKKYPANEDIALHLMVSLFNMGNVADHLGGRQVREEYLPTMSSLCVQFPNNANMAVQLARFIINVSSFNIVLNPEKTKNELLPLLEELYHRFPENSDIAGPYANGLNTVFSITGKTNISFAERAYVPTLRELQHRFPDNLEIAGAFMNQLVSVSAFLGVYYLDRVVKDYLPEACALQKAFAADSGIAWGLASIIGNIALYKKTLPEAATVTDLFPLFAQLLDQFPDNVEIAAKLLVLLEVIFDLYELFELFEFEEKYLPALLRLQKRLPDQVEIALRVVQYLDRLVPASETAIYNELQLRYLPHIFEMVERSGHQLQLANKFLDILYTQSCREDLTDIVAFERTFFPFIMSRIANGVVDQESWGLYSQILCCWAIDLIPQRPAYMEEIYLPLFKEAVNAFPYNEPIAVRYSKLLVNLGLAQGAEQPEKVQSVYNPELARLSDKFPGSLSLLNHYVKSLLNFSARLESGTERLLVDGILPLAQKAHRMRSDNEEAGEQLAKTIVLTCVASEEGGNDYCLETLLPQMEALVPSFPGNEAVATFAGSFHACIMEFMGMENDGRLDGYVAAYKHRLTELYEKYPLNGTLAYALMMALGITIAAYPDNEAAPVADDWAYFQKISSAFPENQLIQELVSFLKC